MPGPVGVNERKSHAACSGRVSSPGRLPRKINAEPLAVMYESERLFAYRGRLRCYPRITADKRRLALVRYPVEKANRNHDAAFHSDTQFLRPPQVAGQLMQPVHFRRTAVLHLFPRPRTRIATSTTSCDRPPKIPARIGRPFPRAGLRFFLGPSLSAPKQNVASLRADGGGVGSSDSESRLLRALTSSVRV